MFLQTDEAQELDKEAADKPAGKNSITSIPYYYQEKQTLTGVEFRTAFRYSFFVIRIRNL